MQQICIKEACRWVLIIKAQKELICPTDCWSLLLWRKLKNHALTIKVSKNKDFFVCFLKTVLRCDNWSHLRVKEQIQMFPIKKKAKEMKKIPGKEYRKDSRPDLPVPFMLVSWEHTSLCVLLRAEASTFLHLTICKRSCNQMRQSVISSHNTTQTAVSS